MSRRSMNRDAFLLEIALRAVVFSTCETLCLLLTAWKIVVPYSARTHSCCSRVDEQRKHHRTNHIITEEIHTRNFPGYPSPPAAEVAAKALTQGCG